MSALDRAKALHDTMVAWRHTLHANPETAYEEFDTSAFVAERLKSFGLDVHTKIAKTGVVGVLTRGDGESIGLRADMDALNMQELNTFTHASKVAGKMHACGHDGHITMLLGAAKILAQSKDFQGTVVFVFQPAEEMEGGAEAMVREGLFEKFPVQEIHGMHNWPALPAGHMAVGPAAMMAACDTFEIKVTGKGGHAAMPHLGVDPVLAASHMVTALQSLPSRWASPQEACVVSVTQIHAGDTWNVIPETVLMRGTTRWLDLELGKGLKKALKKIIFGLGDTFGCQIELSYQTRYPPTINTIKQAAMSAEVMENLVGGGKVDRNPTPSMGSEDFAFMLGKKPGSYCWLGTGEQEDCPKLHNPYFDFNDMLLSQGAAYWVALVEHRLTPF